MDQDTPFYPARLSLNAVTGMVDTIEESASASSRNLDQTVKNKDPEESLVCRVCHKRLSSQKSLKRHMLLHLPTPRPALPRKHSCHICGKLFATPTAVQRHMSVHTGSKSFECEYCDKQFTQKVHYQAHVKRVHTAGAETFSCTALGCNRKFVAEHMLRTHVKRVHSGKPKKNPCKERDKIHDSKMADNQGTASRSHTMFLCKICESLFLTEEKLKVHNLTYHNSETAYECQVCSMRLFSGADFQSHAQGPCGQDAYKYKCKKCTSRFSQEAALKTHMKTHEKVVFECGICGKHFEQFENLRGHMAKCAFSQQAVAPVKKKFAFSQQAVAPVKKTVVNKQFECKVCEERFATLSQLDDHEYSHKPDGPQAVSLYTCRTCEQGLPTMKTLLHHIVVNHAMAYVCRVCGERFKQSDQVTDHRKEVHGVADALDMLE